MRLFGVDICNNNDRDKVVHMNHISNEETVSTSKSTNGTFTTNNNSLITHQERVPKRSCSWEESENTSKKPKKQKNPRPTKEQKKKADFKPPNLPSELIEKVKGLTDEVPKLVMQKYITVTDVSEHHKRLLISKTDMRKVNGCMLLNDQEKRELDQGRDIKVIVILETKEEVNLSLSKWPKKNSELDESTRNYVLQSDWIEVTNKIDLKEDDVGQLWTFRFGQDKREPGFVFLKVFDDNKLNNA